MGKSLVAVVVMLAACQPMYERPPQKLKNPPRVEPKKGTDTAATDAPPKYDDNCIVDFSGPPTTKRQVAKADQLVGEADTALDGSKTVAAEEQRMGLTLRSIEQYRAALVADPYSAEATLKLALAYDKVLRRGCAIAMLKRLEKLAQNPKFKAEPAIDRVVDNEQWFKPYRQDALRAIGH